MSDRRNSEVEESGVVLVSGNRVLWWLTCPTCEGAMYGLADRTWMIMDPICPSCNKMIAGLTNPYLQVQSEIIAYGEGEDD